MYRIFIILICAFVLSGCMIHNGRIATDTEIIEHPDSREFREKHIETYNAFERFRMDHLNTFKWFHGRRKGT